jgi:Ni,Fe-hydrogenase I cytochrome b subunit
MKVVFAVLTGIQLIMTGIALYYDEYKSAKWFFLSACIFAVGFIF